MVRLHAPNTGGMGLVPDQGIKIPHATLHGQKKKKKKRKEILTYHNMNETWRCYAKWNQSQKDNVWLYLYKVSNIVKFTEIENRMVVDRVWWGREWVGVFHRYEVSFGKMKNILEMYGSNACTKWMSLRPLNSAIKNNWNKFYVMHILPQLKKCFHLY